MSAPLRILVTNDDGVDSPGIHALARAAVDAGHQVTIAAPLVDHSGFGAALGPLHVTGEIAFEHRQVPHLPPSVTIVGVDGPPALSALAACLGGFGEPPDLVLSGINVGANLGRAVLHSGTVGAVLTANNFGVAGIAVSQVHGDVQHWAMAAEVAVELVDWVIGVGAVSTLNVNVPNVAERPANAIVATLEIGGQVQTRMVERATGVLSLDMDVRPVPQPGTDAAVLADGCIAITPLGGIHPLDVDLSGAIAHLQRSAHQQVA